MLAAVSSSDPASAVHGAILLKAVRTTYNIFLLSKSAQVQIIAQATLTQMVQAVYGRLPKDFAKTLEKETGSQSSSPGQISPAKVSEGEETENQDKPQPDDDTISQTSTAVINRSPSGGSLNEGARPAVEGETDQPKDIFNDIHIKDAYLVFRALCKLSMKPIPAPEGFVKFYTSATDLKSHSMRSKLLSLHLIHTIVTSHLSIFYTNSPVLFSTPQNPPLFIHSVKQYLCLTLSRNAASVVPQVFDTAMDIFGKALVGLRTVLKVR